MAKEIERKFLVTGNEWKNAKPIYYCQGYLNRDQHRTVRIRIANEEGYLTIKGMTSGISRDEFEYTIPLEDAKQMVEMCEKPLIIKNRRVINYAGMDWEIDEFLGENQGLVVAEIELVSEEQAFEKPAWVGEEVSDDPRYHNSRLCTNPFSTW